MADNLSVKITADVVDLQAKFAVAKSESAALTAELNKLAREARGGMTDELKGRLTSAAEAMINARARASELGSELHKTGVEGTAGMNTLRHELLGLADPIRGVYNSVGELAEAFAGLYVAKGLYDAVEATAEWGEGLKKLSEQTGVSVEKLSAFQYGADQVDVSAESLNNSMLRLGRAVQEAMTVPTSQAAEAFTALGISQQFLTENSNNLEAVLRKVADAFADHATGANADAVAMAIFGRAGADLIPFLRQGSEGLDQMQAKAAQLGVTLSGSTAEAMEKHVQAVKDMEGAWSGLWRALQGPIESLGTGLAHALTGDIELIERLKSGIDSTAAVTNYREHLPFAGADTQAIAHGADNTGLAGNFAATQPQIPDLEHTHAEASANSENLSLILEQRRQNDALIIQDIENTEKQIEESAKAEYDAWERVAVSTAQRQKQFDEDRATSAEQIAARIDAINLKSLQTIVKYNQEIDKEQAEQDQKAADEKVKIYEAALGPINSALSQILHGHVNYSQLAVNLEQGLALKAIEGVEQSVGASLFGGDKGGGVLGQGLTLVASALGLNTAALGLNTSSILTWAASAASSAGSSILGGIGAVAGILGFDSGATEIGRSGLAMVHSGEAVVPATVARDWRDTDFGGSTTNNGGHTFNFHNTVNGSDSADIMGHIEANSHRLVGVIRDLFRSGALR